ncbi:MAG TPA: papain-like cysteine protease family protein [Micropepsaceae bacterium]|jgi:hypothetical protein
MELSSLFSASRLRYGQSTIAQEIGDWLFESTALNFNMQAQTQTNWCWAATSTSVSHFYWSASTWTQCSVASAELGRTDCCNASVPSACNVSWYLDRALTRTSNLQSMVTGTIGFDAILAELRAGRVVGARIGWSGGGGHFMCIYGCSRVIGTEYVDIDDPIYGKSHITLATFTSNYQGSGSWTHTYYTKRYPILHIRLPILEAVLLEKIREARPLLAVKRGSQDFQTVLAPAADLAVPHHVYVAGLHDLTQKENPLPANPTAMRVFEVTGDRNTALFDVSLPEQGPAQVLSMSDDAASLDLLTRGLTEISRMAARGEGEPELRFLRIPALYVEAFWLHYPDSAKDVMVPVRGIGLFTPFQPVAEQQFLDAVRKAARERSHGAPDDTIAP